MEAEETNNVVTLSHQALKKGELRTLTAEFEQRTLKMLADLENPNLNEMQRRLIGQQLGKRFEFLGRLQKMGLTQTPNDFDELFNVWQEVQRAG